MYWRQASI